MSESSAVEIRVARRDELAIIQELNSKSFENDLKNDPYLVMDWPTNPETGEAYFKDRLEGNGVVLVAEVENEVVGYLAGATQPIESYRSGSRGELENMFVREEARRFGVGTALIDGFVKWCREQKADEVYVSAYFGNDRAVSFYRSNGFQPYAHALLLNLRPD